MQLSIHMRLQQAGNLSYGPILYKTFCIRQTAVLYCRSCLSDDPLLGHLMRCVGGYWSALRLRFMFYNDGQKKKKKTCLSVVLLPPPVHWTMTTARRQIDGEIARV